MFLKDYLDFYVDSELWGNKSGNKEINEKIILVVRREMILV